MSSSSSPRQQASGPDNVQRLPGDLWKVAVVQMDCRLGENALNLQTIRARLREAAGLGARLIVFPECVLTGYGFESKAEAMGHAEPLPGPSTVDLALICQELDVWVVYGLLERDGDRLFNAAALIGPNGFVAGYRKIHLPFLGVDRFAAPGDRPFAVHDLGGLKIGMAICYDAGFPESVRVLTLMGADLVVLPTNWPHTSLCTARIVSQARALENTIYFAAANRIGEEAGFRFVGLSKIVAPDGSILAEAGGDRPEMLVADVAPAVARAKHLKIVPGKHELNRIADRRPEMYQRLTEL